MIRFLLIRHGETEWNRLRIIQGQFDSPLNFNGLAQAETVAARLENERIDEIWSSDLSRASDTAARIAQRQRLGVRLDRRLRERHFGLFQGMTFAHAESRYPQHYAEYSRMTRDSGVPQGETNGSFYDRVADFLRERANTARPGQTLLLATHGGVVSCCYRLVNDIPLDLPRTWSLPNAAINEFVYENGAWRMERFADVSHLQQMLDDIG